MAFINQNQAIVAFKQLLGKSNTDVSKEAGNEAEGIFFNVPATAVWMDDINATPSVAVAAGKAVAVTCPMVVDGTSNGHALFATWPVTAPSGTDPRTANPFTYGTGSLTGIFAGDRVRNAIPPSYGVGYEAKPYAGLNLISPGDQRDWIYQYNSGVFFQQDGANDIPAYGGSSYTNPTTIQLYVYVGSTLDTFTGGGTSEWYDSVASTTSTPPGSPNLGDRYIIGTGATGDWAGLDNKIAEWQGVWEFTTPTQGGTVLVDDDPGFVYIYGGIYPTGSWGRVPFGTTRAGVASGTDTYTMTVSPPILAYTLDLIILATFTNANTGASTLDINSLGPVSILKPDGLGGLVNLSANDLKPGQIYMIVYDGFTFQIFTGGDNAIPLTGTISGFPVTGDIEVEPGTKIYTTGSPSNPDIRFEMDRIILENGDVEVGNLAGIGDRVVKVDASGVLFSSSLSGTSIKYVIESTDDITVADKFQYFVYGDLTIDPGGILTNYGQIVIMNGGLINNGTFNNFGTLLIVNVALGTNKKYKATFTATAGVPFNITHNLSTLDFVYTVREGNDDAVVQLTRIDANNVEVVSNVNMTGVITIIGY